MATAKEIRQLGIGDLERRVGELRETLSNLRIQHRTGSLSSSSDIGKNRRELARVLTVLGELKREAGRPVEKKA